MPDRIRALYVDDEPGLLEVARLFLEQSPEFSVETEESAQAALNSPAIATCDVIISDYQMPGMDGIAFLKTVREKYGTIPFILFTGRGREEVVIEAINNGADFYLQKGGDPTAQFAELAHKIRQAVSRKRSQEQLQAAYEQITASEEELRGQYEKLAQGEQRVRESQEQLQAACNKLSASEEILRQQYDEIAAAHHQIEESRQQLAEIADTVPGVVFQTRFQSGEIKEVTFISSRAPTVFGIRADKKDVLEQFFAGVDPRDRVALDRSIQEATTREVPWEFEGRFIKPGGERIWFQGLARPIQKPSGLYYNGVLLDITTRKKAEETILENAAKLQEAQQMAHLGFWNWDIKTGTVKWSDEVFRIFGLDKETFRPTIDSILARSPWPEEQNRAKEIVQKATESHEPGSYEQRFLRPDNSIGYYYSTFQGRYDDKGNLTSVVGTVLDITSRKKAEMELRVSEERYRSIIEYSPYGMHFYALDPTRGLVFTGANPAADRILGVSHDQFIGKAIEEAFPGLAGTDIPLAYRRAAETGTVWETEQVRYDKGSISGAYSVVAFRTAPGSMAAMFLDITKRKKADMERQESEERLRSFMDSATDAFAIWDARLNLVDMNRVALSYLPDGTRKEDIIGRNLSEFLSGEGEWGSIERYREILTTGVPLTGTEKMTESAKGTRWLSLKCFRVGEGLGIMTTDVTREKAAEERLREAYGKLAASEEEIRRQYRELASAQEELRENRIQMTEIAETVPGVIFQSHFPPGEKEKFMFISSHGPEVFGISADPEGFSERFYARVDASDLELLERSISQAVENELPWEYEGRFTKPSGEKMWFQGLARPVRKASGLYYTGVLLDITSRKRAEEELRASEERLRLFIQQAPVAIAMFDTDMHYLAASRRWMGDYNLGDRDITGRSHYEIFPEISEDFRAIHRRGLGGEVISSAEDRFVRSNGSVQWVAWEVRPWYTTGNAIGGIIIYSEDITKRKEMEEELRESEEKYRSLVDVSPVAVAVHRDGTVIYVNPEAVRLLKCSRAEDLIGKEVMPFIHPDYHKKAREDFRRMADEGEMIPLQEETLLATNGEPFTVEVVAKPIRYEGMPAVFVAFRDITERKKMEAALRESEEKYRNLVENATEAIFILQDRRMIYANPRMGELLGVPAESLLEYSFLDYVWPADRAFVLDRYTRRMAGEDVPTTYDFRMTGPEGKLLWVHISIAKVTWQQKPATLNLLTDITERKRAETALQEAWRKLALLNSLTRHDIRNQLITLQGFTQFALKKEQDPAIAGYLEKIDSCATMIRGQIEFMKTYHELGVNSPSWYQLDEVVSKACIRELPCRNLCSGTEVFADPMLEKVFFNLFDNAHRHGEHATQAVVRCETTGDDLTIVVEDNGTGIPDDEKEKVFLKGYGKNTGFGLFLAREILSITGITIRETGVPGTGARFEILVPRECWRNSGA